MRRSPSLRPVATAVACSRPIPISICCSSCPTGRRRGARALPSTCSIMLWDLGLKVGHATRTVAQCMSALPNRHDDPHVAARCPLPARRRNCSTPNFEDPAIRERRRRRQRSASSSRPRWPNARAATGKPAKAAIASNRTSRTARAACAISTRCTGSRNTPTAAGPADPDMPPDVFEPEEIATFRRSEDFLWTVRCLMHFETRTRRRTTRLRDPAGDCRAAELPRRWQPAARRALHASLLPGRQGRRRADRDSVLIA